MPNIRSTIAACVLVLSLPAAAHAAGEPHEGSAAYAPSPHASSRLDSLAAFSGRWSARLVTQLDRDRLPNATPLAPVGEALPPLPAPLLTKPAIIVATASDAQWLGAEHTAKVVGTDPVRDPAYRATSGEAAPASFSQKLGSWAILGVFIKFGVLPLLPGLAAVAVGVGLLRRRRLRTLASAPVPAPAVAHGSLRPEPESDGASDDANPDTAEVFDFALDSTISAEPTHQTRDASEIAELRLRAGDLGHRIADPEQRRRLALASSYLDLGHLTAARELIEDIERTDHDAWKLLFAGQSAAS